MRNILKRYAVITAAVLFSQGAGAQAAEQTIFGGSVPSVAAETSDQSAVQLGVRFRSSANGQIRGVRFYRAVESSSNYIVNLFNANGTRLATARLNRVNGAAAGWREVRFATPVNIQAGTVYTASYYVANGQYPYTSNGLSTAKTNGNLTALASAPESNQGNGVYIYGSSSRMPKASYENTNYFVDVIFAGSASAPADSQAPSVPANLAATASSASQVALSFNASSDINGIAGYRIERCSGAGCTSFAQIASVNATSYSDSNLSASTSYSYRVRAADPAGNLSGYSNVASAVTAQTPTTPTEPQPPTSSDVEVPGPSAKMHLNHPHYTCVQNRYVSTTGNDSNDGLSLATAWRTLQKANGSVAAGTCVNIADGVYNVSSTISLSRGGNAASMTGFVVYRAINMLGARFEAQSGFGGLLNVTAPYIIIDGLELDGNRLAGVDTGINTCLGTAGSYNGIHHVAVFNSYIHDVGGNGIALCWAEYYWMIHNRSDNNAYASWNSGISTYEPMAIPGYTPNAYDNKFTPYRNVYAYNRFNGNFTSASGGPHTDGNGLIYDDTRHQQMSPNTTYPHSALIMGNLSTNNGGAGIQIGPTSANADVFNNTCYNNYLDPLNDGTWRGSLSASFTVNVRYINNIGVGIAGSGILSNNSAFMGGNPVSGTMWSNNVAQGRVDMQGGASFPATSNKTVSNVMLVNMSGGDFALCRGPGVPNASCTGASPAYGFGAQVPYWQQQTAGQIDVGACPRGLDTCRSR